MNIYIYKEHLELNNLQGLICQKTQPTNQILVFTNSDNERVLHTPRMSRTVALTLDAA